MVFFNYSTMQMAAKVVYYGPGLCGKTTNLQHIYGQTSSECRGEMVSLETETDRTLFFDLLPIDVGQIAGFDTRIQLYTVPGQVFYNTTRKLVLKGVDGVVFVVDSQRAMLQANIDSFNNLQENLAEMGLSVDEIPIVLQYNKRDLDDVCTFDELNDALNHGDWPWFEASAIHGQGVFETLKGISKITLVALKQRLTEGRDDPSSADATPTPAGPVPGPAPVQAPAQASAPSPPPTVGSAAKSEPSPAPSAAIPPAATPGAALGPTEPPAAEAVTDKPAQSPPAPTLSPARAADLAASGKLPPSAASPSSETPSPSLTPARSRNPAPKAPAAKSKRGHRDVLFELERLRKEAMQIPASGRASNRSKRSATPQPETNGKGQLRRDIQLTLAKGDFLRARRFSVSLQVEDGDRQIVEAVRDFQVDLRDTTDLAKVLLQLNIALSSKD